MDSYSNKINRIKYTIDEIRDDIEQMKQVRLLIFLYNITFNNYNKYRERMILSRLILQMNK